MISVENIVKSYGPIRALKGVSFTIGKGEVVGYVGLNGAGKTTTIRIAVGVLPPDSGDVVVDGYSVIREKRMASRLIGWVPEQPVFEPDAKAIDYFVYLAGYYGISGLEARSTAKRLLEEVGLGEAANRKLKEFSQGMRKRFALAVSMINNPPNFFFDEVLNGLDPQGIAFFRNLVLEFKREGRSVLFSSHILSEVEGVADKVVFIHKGRIVAVKTMQEIKSMAKPAVKIKLVKLDDGAIEILRGYGAPRLVGENTVLLEEPRTGPAAVNRALVEAGYDVEELVRVEARLEDVFFRIIGGGEK